VADHRPARGPQRAVRGVRAGLWDGVRRFVADDAAVLVLTGAGDRAFCAGGDLKEMADARWRCRRRTSSRSSAATSTCPSRRSRPSTAWPTRAGSCWRSSATSVVAAEHAAFAVTEVRVGPGCAVGRAAAVAGGPRAAAEILLTGEPVSAGAGVRDRAGQPGGRGRRSCTSDAGAGERIAPTRRCRWRRPSARCTCRRPRRRPTRSGRRSTARPTHKEGPRAFREKRTPVWRGR
jgi:enoyl-CoA hydratase/carnithine racemase